LALGFNYLSSAEPKKNIEKNGLRIVIFFSEKKTTTINQGKEFLFFQKEYNRKLH